MKPSIDSVWRAPLVPVALAATAGIVLDRFAAIPLAISGVAVLASLAAWAVTRHGPQSGLALLYLLAAVAGLGAAYHQVRDSVYPPDDIGHFATEDPRPARVRGLLAEEPAVSRPSDDPLRSFPKPASTAAVLRVTDLLTPDGWQPVSGRARLTVQGLLPGWHVGDSVEVSGRLVAPPSPANPGEPDYAAFLRDQRIRAQIVVQDTADAVTRLEQGWPGTLAGWLAVVRGWGQRRLEEHLPADQVGVASALLLGDGSAMTGTDWDRYMRTGVLHVLAISGQHLVVLAFFLWWVMRLCGVRQRRGAAAVALFLLAYALLTGGRPPVLRSAVMVCAAGLGLILRRPALPANSFALAWLIVAALNPMDVFNTGCQLSFLSVAVLFWGTSSWRPDPRDPMQQLIDEGQSDWERLLRWLGRAIVLTYAVSLAIWLAIAPLVAARYHLISPVGLLIGPPMVLLTSIALISGFLLLVSSAVFWPFAPVFGWLTQLCLSACNIVVSWGSALPAGHCYVADVPSWWLWVFYPALLALLWLPLPEWRWRWALPAALAWLCVGLVGGSARPAPGELRCTFLAVGHGGCTVLETPDGRVILYDTGSLAGPEVAARQVAPFLWGRGIRRIDEVILSHADLDHFNGLSALLDRFAVGQVTCTPSFSERPTGAVRVTLEAFARHGVAVRVVQAGDRLAADDVDLRVLHPPAAGPEGNENSRSLVVLVRHLDHTLLLTGDLEGAGLDMLLRLPPLPVDVLMAPHHGSRTANPAALADWAKPRIVVSCEGPPRGPVRPAEPYSERGAHFFGTWPHGAVTVRSSAQGLIVETFRSGQRIVVR